MQQRTANHMMRSSRVAVEAWEHSDSNADDGGQIFRHDLADRQFFLEARMELHQLQNFLTT
jgi:hypothetical protein